MQGINGIKKKRIEMLKPLMLSYRVLRGEPDHWVIVDIGIAAIYIGEKMMGGSVADLP